MNFYRLRKFTVCLAALITAVALLCACDRNQADWEDTLPSVSLTKEKSDIQIIEEDTKPPISIEMPELTTASELNTELATTLEPKENDDENTDSSALQGSVSGVPNVPISEYTSSSPTVVSVPPESDDTDTSSETPAQTVTAYDTITSVTTLLQGTSVLTPEEDVPYTFNDPISKTYAYSQLSENDRKFYDIVINAIKNHESEIDVPSELNITANDYYNIYQLIYNTEHSVFYIDTQMKYTSVAKTKQLVTINFCYTYTTDEVKYMQNKIDAEVKKIISGIDETMSEYDIVKYFYDTLVLSCVYDEEPANCRDIYGCFVEKRAVCGGYAKAFSYLCDKVGIESLTITGDFEGTPHMWNMVKLGGSWYHIDVTSGYVSNDDATSYIRYDYFCVTDSDIDQKHDIYDQDYSYPTADSLKYNYFEYNNLIADSWEETISLLTDQIIKTANKGERAIQIKCADDATFDTASHKLFDRSEAYALTILENAYDRCSNKYLTDIITYNCDEKNRIIKIFLVYPEDNTENLQNAA